MRKGRTLDRGEGRKEGWIEGDDEGGGEGEEGRGMGGMRRKED